METRSFDIRSVDLEKREVTGVAVPYGVDAIVGGYSERFEKGAIETHEGVKLFWNHQEPIGRVTGGTETDEGYTVTAVISETARGNEAYTLLRDGVIDKFSVGFVPVEHTTVDGVLVRTKVNLKEVSLVPFPAYEGATIAEVRASVINEKEDSNESNMENLVNEDYEARFEVIERDLAVVKENGGATSSESVQYRNAGEFLKALAAGEEAAKTEASREVRAYTGAVLSDSHTSPDWKADALRIVDRGRPLVNAFDRGSLGPNGMSVTYPKVNAVTGDVALQAAEGDNLAYIELDVDEATAPVKTYGAYSELSRQVIERSDVSFLETTLKAQAASYAKVTNAAVRAAVVAATPQTSGVASFALTSAGADKFISVAADAVQKIDANGYFGQSADFMLVSWDVYNKMVTLVDSAGRPIFDLNNDGANTTGNAGLVVARASVAGLPVVVDSGLSAKTLYVCNSHAVETWENSGAPLRLQDENIINLTKQFSLYGYMAVGVKDANGLVKATIS